MSESEADPLDAYMSAIEAANQKLQADPTPVPPPAPYNDTDDSDSFEPTRPEDDAPKDEIERLLALAAKRAQQKELTPTDHSQIKYPPFRRMFYKETDELARMTEEQVRHYRHVLHNMKIRGQECPKPIQNWAQAGLGPGVLELLLQDLNFMTPTPVQSQAIPALLAGRDVIVVAKTGSGKTLSFVIPMLRHVSDQPRSTVCQGPIGLVLTPTRELAMQTYRESRRFASAIDPRIKTVCAYGGAPIAEQIADLKRGVDVVVCTPGRLIDLLLANAGKVTDLRRVSFVVLDEADRMFDMGFGPQVLQIVNNIRPDRQAVLFSATFPKQMEALAKRILTRPLEITVGAHSTVCDDIEQQVWVVEEEGKFLRLLRVLGEWYQTKTDCILIFVDRQDAADNLMRDLLRRGYPCISLHGGKDQAERDQAIADFKSGSIPIMIATSIAARGLDVRHLSLVINYECPNHREDYVHRVGRTGRAGRKGTAITFITPPQERFALGICQALKASRVAVPERLQAMADAFAGKLQAGTVQAVGRGFGGKGLERIDDEREATIRTQKHTILNGNADLDIIDSASDDDDDAVPGKRRTKQTVSKASKQPGRRNTTDPSKLSDQQRLLLSSLMQKADQLEAAMTIAYSRFDPVQELNERLLPHVSSQPSNTSSNQQPTSGEIVPVYDMSKQPPEPREWTCDLDINDYPQLTRHRIVHKDTLRGVCEMVGGRLVVLVKGVHVPAGRPVPPRERRLYLRLEGESREVVEEGKAELTRLLLQSALDLGKAGDVLKMHR